jgi:hypothetical protein
MQGCSNQIAGRTSTPVRRKNEEVGKHEPEGMILWSQLEGGMLDHWRGVLYVQIAYELVIRIRYPNETIGVKRLLNIVKTRHSLLFTRPTSVDLPRRKYV